MRRQVRQIHEACPGAFICSISRLTSPDAVQHRLILIVSHPSISPALSRPFFMSSTTTSTAKFQSILDAALESYVKQTGIELTKHPSADNLQNCHSPEDVIQLLLERETAFKNYRDKYRKLIDCFRPIVQVVHAFSGIVGDSDLVSFWPGIFTIRLYPFATQQVPFKPTKAIFISVNVLLSVCLLFLNRVFP
jgi:hypothetical protein